MDSYGWRFVLLLLAVVVTSATGRDLRTRFATQLNGDELREMVGSAAALRHEAFVPAKRHDNSDYNSNDYNNNYFNRDFKHFDNSLLIRDNGAALVALSLHNLLVPRVSGSEANANVRNHIVTVFKALQWSVEIDAFDSETPHGKLPFANIVATKNSNAKHKLVLAAHYDSKFFDGKDFIGATDSAIPCAILIAIAHAINPLLEAQDLLARTTVQFIFFDGEEAFVNWSATDSLYGSRHLAEKWETLAADGSTIPSFSSSTKSSQSSNKKKSILKSIDAFILLDLLGDPTSTFINLNSKTTWIWERLVNIEQRLASLQLLSPQKSELVNVQNEVAYFVPGISTFGSQAIDDDHRPFRDRGVPIVHVIAVPFPKTWHTLNDDSDHVNPNTASDLARIFTVLVVEYLGLLV
ncbi:hypothetical protein HK100_007244 [Physocladia obscura]|uniref:Peptide hydrolase n=1 Tax=Physocladia obscura TaxID=109957 RepID=A0AAD5SRV5_9FUNG|nr:hypothetical protein HK100_007244 [Physocladia obscura]